jgi:hypothetical protein
MQTHGTEDGRWRGGRAREIYGNDFHNAHAHAVGGIRSGVTIMHHNTFDGVQPPRGLVLEAYRPFFKWPACPFYGASGDNPWDANDPHGVYESGTATSRTKTTIVDTSKNWTPNQWTNFTAKFIGDNQVAFIESNTPNTLNVMYYPDSGGGHVWQAGDRYQIHRVDVALDQPGRGQGDLIIGDSPHNPHWPNQRLEPTYCWNNIYTPTGAHINAVPGPGNGRLQQLGRDYFNDTPMPGYTPYVYPHPLTRGLPPPEQMTRNATANSQEDPRKKRRPWGGKEPERKKAKKAKESPKNETADRQENLGQ